MKNQPWVQRYCGDEWNATAVLTIDEFGLLQRFRDYAWTNGGIPADESFLKRLAKIFQVSAYKFKKIWAEISNFFTIRDGVFYYEDDEAKRQSQVVNIAKSKHFGKLGAEKRWGKQAESASEPGSPPDSPPYADPIANQNQNHSHIQKEEPPPPPETTTEENGGGGGLPPELAQLPTLQQQALPDSAYQQICQRAIDLGFAAPQRKLAQRIFQEFGSDINALMRVLVKWEGQEGAGLWGSKCRGDFELEAARQAQPRKPIMRDTDRLASEMIAERRRQGLG